MQSQLAAEAFHHSSHACTSLPRMHRITQWMGPGANVAAICSCIYIVLAYRSFKMVTDAVKEQVKEIKNEVKLFKENLSAGTQNYKIKSRQHLIEFKNKLAADTNKVKVEFKEFKEELRARRRELEERALARDFKSEVKGEISRDEVDLAKLKDDM